MNARSFTEMVRRQWVVVVATLIIGAGIFVFVLPFMRAYTATATVLTASAPSQQAAALDPKGDPTTSSVSLTDLPALITSQTVLRRVTNDLGLTPKQSAKLPTSIKAKAAFNSSVIPISFTAPSKSLAVAGANTITSEFAKYDKQLLTQRYDALIADMKKQIAQRSTSLAALDTKIAQLTGHDPFLSTKDGTDALSTRIIALQQQRDTVQAAMLGDAAAAAIAAKRPVLTRELAKHEIIANDPTVNAVKQQYGKDLATLDQQKAAFTSRYPGLTGLSSSVSRENASLNRQVADATANPAASSSYVNAQLDANKANAALDNDRAQLKSLNAKLDTYENHLDASASDSTKVVALQRERVAGESAYTQLADGLAKAVTDRAQASAIDSVIVIDLAQGASPVMLSRPAVLGSIFAVIFVWLALTLAFVADGSDGRLRTPESIEELYGTPVYTPVG